MSVEILERTYNPERFEVVRERISPFIAQTALTRLDYFGNGVELWLKHENAQKTGSFKLRPALAAMLELQDEGHHKAALASAGNFGAGGAYAANLLGIDLVGIVPEGTPAEKIQNMKLLGGDNLDLRVYGKAYDDSRKYAGSLGRRVLEAFDSQATMAGNATLGPEITEQLPGVKRIFLEAGGAGLTGGLVGWAARHRPDLRFVAVQFEGHDSLERSVQAGEVVEASHLDTYAFCEGSRVRRIGHNCLEKVLENPAMVEYVTVKHDDVGRAIEEEIERRHQYGQPINDPNDPFPEATGFMAEAGARVYHQTHPGVRDEQWVAVRSGSNSDAIKAWDTYQQVSPIGKRGVNRVSSGFIGSR